MARDEQADEPQGIRRRTLLGAVIGATAASGLAARELTDRGSSSNRPAGADGAASAVKVQPAGELIASDVQSALADVYDRTSALARLEDLQVAFEILDDFPLRAGTGQIGSAGWFAESAGSGAGIDLSSPTEGGVVRLTTGTQPDGRCGIHLGLDQHAGAPVFTLEWRVMSEVSATADDDFTLRLGAVDSVSAGAGDDAPHGIYFAYDRSAHGPTWHCVCVNAKGQTAVDSKRTPSREFHRFRITSDGGGLARFYLNEDLVASVSTNLPLETDRYGHGVAVAKAAGANAAPVSVDWFYVRRELPR